MQAFYLRPVVLIRNVFDALVSMTDFYDSGAVRNSFLTDFSKLDRETRLDAIIDHWAQWYIQFFASWAQADDAAALPVHWLNFETMMARKAEAIRDVCDFYGLKKADREIGQAISLIDGDKARTRFNKGVTGSGKTEFSQAQQDRVRRMADDCPAIDFSPVGI